MSKEEIKLDYKRPAMVADCKMSTYIPGGFAAISKFRIYSQSKDAQISIWPSTLAGQDCRDFGGL